MAERVDVKALLLNVEANVELLRRGMNQGVAAVDKFDKQAQRLLDRFDGRMARVGQRGMPALQANLDKVRGSIGAVAAGLGVLGVGASARTFLSLADQAKSLDAQLRLATQGLGSFGEAQADVRRIAAETRTSLEATASLYGNFIRAAGESGRTQGDAARATETFSKALKIGGATAEEAASATLQFGQALASGVLRGDEFNSIAEASPRILRLLADSLGVPAGQLRALAAQGKLTSEVLYTALTDKRFTASLDAEFAKLPQTFDESMQQIRNAAVITFGAFDRGGQFSQSIANFATQGATDMKSLETAAENLAISIRASLAGLSSAFQPLLDAARAAYREIFGMDWGKSGAGTIDIQGSLDQVDTATGWLSRQGPLGAVLTGNSPFSNRDQRTGSNFGGRYRDASTASARMRRLELGEQALLDRFGFRGSADGAWGPFQRREAPKPTPSAADTAKAAREAAAARRKEAQAVVDAANDARAYAAARRSANDTIARAHAELTNSAAERAQIERDRVEADRVSKNDEIALQGKAGRYTAERVKALQKLNDQAAAAQTAVIDTREQQRLVDEAASVASRALDTQRDILEQQAGLTRTAAERRAIELRLLDLQRKQEELALDNILKSTTTSPEEKARARTDKGTLNARYGVREAGIMQSTAGPGEAYLRSLPQSAAEVKEAIDGIKVNGLQSLNNELADAILGAKSLGAAFKNVANQIIGDLLRIAIQQTLIKPLAESLFGGGGGGGGGIFGSLFKIGTSVAGAREGGGPVSAGRAYLVGEKRPELFVPSVNGTIIPRVGGGGGGQAPVEVTVKVEAGDYFDARVASIAAPIGQAAAIGGANLAHQRAAKAAGRRMGR